MKGFLKTGFTLGLVSVLAFEIFNDAPLQNTWLLKAMVRTSHFLILAYLAGIFLSDLIRKLFTFLKTSLTPTLIQWKRKLKRRF